MIAASVVNQQSEEECDVAIAVDDGIKKRAESGDLSRSARHAAIYHVKNSSADNHQSGIRKEPAIIIGIGVAKKNGCNGVDDQSKEGQHIGGDSGKRKTANNRVQQNAASSSKRPRPGHEASS
jgi:hypothetical protein